MVSNTHPSLCTRGNPKPNSPCPQVKGFAESELKSLPSLCPRAFKATFHSLGGISLSSLLPGVPEFLEGNGQGFHLSIQHRAQLSAWASGHFPVNQGCRKHSSSFITCRASLNLLCNLTLAVHQTQGKCWAPAGRWEKGFFKCNYLLPSPN